MKISIFGFVLWVVSAVLYVFKIVTKLMEREDEIKIFTIEEIAGLDWIDKIPWAGVQDIATNISKMQLGMIFFFVGLIFVVLGIFQKK
jgi:hypothetical protein